MAGNVNTAPTRIKRLATRFSAIYVGARDNSQTGATLRNMVRATIKAVAGQAANIVEVLDSNDVVLAGINSSGALLSNGGVSQLQTATIAISAANIIATTAGAFGHAAGVVLVADPGAGKFVELVSAVVSFTFGVAQYTGGGNVTVNSNGGSAVTGLVSAANSLGAAASDIYQLIPLSTAGNVIVTNKGLNLVAASAFTNPGTATGTVKVFVTYRIHTQ